MPNASVMSTSVICKFFAALIFLLLPQVYANSNEKIYKENAENWSVTSSWIKEIPADQQAIVIGIVLGALNKKIESLLEFQHNREQAAWVSKITACGYSMLSKVATKNAPIQSYLSRHSDLYVQLIRGELKSGIFAKADEALIAEGQAAFSKAFDIESHKAATTQYKDRIAATKLSFVVYSMNCAT
jgi:hypothetical protein